MPEDAGGAAQGRIRGRIVARSGTRHSDIEGGECLSNGRFRHKSGNREPLILLHDARARDGDNRLGFTALGNGCRYGPTWGYNTITHRVWFPQGSLLQVSGPVGDQGKRFADGLRENGVHHEFLTVRGNGVRS
jgi:hypothetical protein